MPVSLFYLLNVKQFHKESIYVFMTKSMGDISDLFNEQASRP